MFVDCLKCLKLIFAILLLSSLGKESGPSIGPSHNNDCANSSLVDIGLLVLEKKIKM